MIKVLNKVISNIKKEPFALDNSIPKAYMFFFIFNKLINLIFGFLILRRKIRCFIHPTAVIKCKSKFRFESNLSIDRNCYIDALSINGIKMGKNVSIGKFTTIECSGSLKNIGKGLIVGNNVGLGSHGFFGCAGGLQIGNDTIFGNFVSIHTENHNYKILNIPIRLQGVNRKGVIIGNNCWIGAKVTILDGAIIEDGCVIAANALVTSGRYKSNCIYGGIPAKFIKFRDE